MVFLILFFILTAILIGRLFYLQVISHKYYQAKALGQQVGFKQTQGLRGEIFFENSKISHGSLGSDNLKGAGINKDKWLLSVVPKLIVDKDELADLLSVVLGESKKDILLLWEKSDSYVIVKKDLSEKEIQEITKIISGKDPNIKEVKGVSLEKIIGRYYPQEKMGAQVLGFLGGDNTGQYGIEGYYDDVLQGKEGIEEEKRGFGIIDSNQSVNLNGSNLYLTIDYNIQFQAEQLLQEEKIKDDIKSGQIIVLQPSSGRILAMANFPSFDLNSYSKEDLDIFQNSTIQKLFEPGSVFKPFTMAMAFNEGKVNDNTPFFDSGSVTIGTDTIRNFDKKSYGQQTMSGILEKSINTGAVFLSQTLTHQTFKDYLEKFGFNDKTGVDLQGESYSRNELLKGGSDFGFATASFGQGIEMTPIQLARAFCVFANGGKLVKPYIVEKITHGFEEQKKYPQNLSQVISKEISDKVTAMLINVVERGFGDGAKIPGYYLAGKTGTAQVPFENKKGYYPDKTIQSFIGFGPALAPQFLILVKLDDPKVPKSSLSAVPIFKKLSQYIINYWQIPPDYKH